MKTCRDGDPERSWTRKGDREVMPTGLVLLILVLYIDLSSDVTFIYWAVVINPFYILIRALKTLFLILFTKSFCYCPLTIIVGANMVGESLCKHWPVLVHETAKTSL